ncbi:MAG: hypothetical protein ABR550_05350, partial [Wenzhouxiangellaceae bacterium]
MNLLTSTITVFAITGLIMTSALADTPNERTALLATTDRLAERSRAAGEPIGSTRHQQGASHDSRYNSHYDPRYHNRGRATQDSRYGGSDRGGY